MRSAFAIELAHAHQQIAGDRELGQWLDQVKRVETWQGFLEQPEFKRGILYGISTAIFNDEKLKIRYPNSYGGTTVHLVHPLGLVKRESVLYLVAIFDGYEDPCWLAVHRITMAFPESKQSRYVPPGFKLADHLQNGLPFKLPGGVRLNVELLFEESVYTSLKERPLCGAMVELPEDGWFRVIGEMPNSMELRWWLLGFNDKVRILNPPELVNELKNLLFDILTGLLGRRAAEEYLDRLLAASRRTGKPLALISVDIDYFKRVNDTYGHGGGDAVLKEVAHLLKSTCRDMDVVSRWGGEEFLILLPDTDTVEVAKIAERLRALVEENPEIKVTISLGVCVWYPMIMQSSSGDDLKLQLLKKVDDALYQAKNNGRNQVCVWNEMTPIKK